LTAVVRAVNALVMRTTPLALSAFLLLACGGDDGGAGGPLSGPAADDLCGDFCTTCNTLDNCQTNCVDVATDPCVNGDAIATWLNCITEDGTCNLEELGACANQVDTGSIHDDWGKACRDKLAACGKSSEEISNSCDLDRIKFVSGDTIGDSMSCFDEDCEAIDACLESAFEGCSLEFGR